MSKDSGFGYRLPSLVQNSHHEPNMLACSEEGDVWRWQMFRCWQWLPAAQFTGRFIYHFGRIPLERYRLGETWSPAWMLLQCFYTNWPKVRLNAPSQAREFGLPSLSSYLLWRQMTGPTIHFPFIPDSQLCFMSPSCPHIGTGIGIDCAAPRSLTL